MSLLFAPSSTKRGPFADAATGGYHLSVASSFLTAPQLCGGCHDVRTPMPDRVTGEPFQRLENLFTEWQEGPYATTQNPYGRVVRCGRRSGT